MERAPPPPPSPSPAAAALGAALDQVLMETPLSPRRPRQDDPVLQHITYILVFPTVSVSRCFAYVSRSRLLPPDVQCFAKVFFRRNPPKFRKKFRETLTGRRRRYGATTQGPGPVGLRRRGHLRARYRGATVTHGGRDSRRGEHQPRRASEELAALATKLGIAHAVQTSKVNDDEEKQKKERKKNTGTASEVEQHQRQCDLDET